MTVTVLDARYQLLNRIGQGGQGRVFRGRDLHTGGTVAIKLLEEDSSPEAVARFAQEGRLAARIRDPHLLAALHFGLSGKQRYIVYDYLDGVAPMTTLQERRDLDPFVVCALARQLLGALEALHKAGVAHLDLAPANCLWRERSTGNFEAFLVDLGSAAATIPVTGGPRRSSEPVGSAYFMAPEMLEGGPVDHRADLWSLGALMYRLLTGVLVVDSDDEDEPIEVAPPAVIDPKIPAAISDLVMVALARVEHRFPSAVAMMAAIDAALANRPPPELVPPRRRASMPLWATVSGMMLTAGVGALVTIGIMNAPTSSAAGPATEVASKEVDASLSELVPESVPLAAVSFGGDVGGGGPSGALPEPPLLLDPPTSSSGEQAPLSVDPESPAAAKQLTWKTVERAVQRRAKKFRKCSTEDAITLGLRVTGGRVVLTSFDGKSATVHHRKDRKLADPAKDGLERKHQCARDVFEPLRLPATRALSGVVAVILE